MLYNHLEMVLESTAYRSVKDKIHLTLYPPVSIIPFSYSKILNYLYSLYYCGLETEPTVVRYFTTLFTIY